MKYNNKFVKFNFFDKKSNLNIFKHMKAISTSLLVLVLLPSMGGI